MAIASWCLACRLLRGSDVVVDARKSLPILIDEWDGCQKCDLSVHRIAHNGRMVFGEGQQRGILFLGEGPGYQEEEVGRPFVGKSGRLLRTFIERLGIKNYYITNVVACRSCTPLTDALNNPIYTKGFRNSPPKMRFKDQSPTPKQAEACAPRAHEEIYMADPVVIVALGQPAAQFLLGHSVQITKMRGTPIEVSLPGAGHVAVLSKKKKEWIRNVKGELQSPTEPSSVRYVMIPTFHPAFVLRNLPDTNPNNPFDQFAADLGMAKKIYKLYYEEMSGMLPEDYDEANLADLPDEIRAEFQEEEANYGDG